MALNMEIYSNGNASSKTVVADFYVDLLSDSVTSPSSEMVYYFKLTTSARDTDNLVYNARIVKDLSDLALNKNVQRASNVATAYTNIESMITDYVYDYINGHDANLYESGVSKKSPMKFT